MSFRRHYGTGSYGTSLVSSPLTSSYTSRGLGGYSSPYVTPQYSPSHTSYGSYGSYGKSGVRTRSSSLPRDTRERSVSRHGSFSRGSSPPRSRRQYHDVGDTSSSSALIDLTNGSLNRHHSFSGAKVTTGVLPLTTPRSSYSRDYGNHYAAAKALARAARSKSIGSTSSISSLSSGYGSRSGSVSEKGDAARGSTTSLGSTFSSRAASRASSLGPENGDIDYKKLYEEQLAETHKVNERLRLTENELRQSRESIDLNTKRFNARLATAESDKKEKRALERKLSEMEEELKLMEQLKQENQRLKDENGALIRVISKLSK